MAAPYQERVFAEKRELDEKLSKLSPFIGSDGFNNLGTEERSLLYQQEQLMRRYSHVLSLRIALFK